MILHLIYKCWSVMDLVFCFSGPEEEHYGRHSCNQAVYRENRG